MKEETAKQLFRRFVLNLSRADEANQVIDLLRTGEARQWFGEIMDETEEYYKFDIQARSPDKEQSAHFN